MSEEQVPSRPGQGAAYAVLVLTSMNLLNYVDRWVPSAVKEKLKEDEQLQLDDAQTGFIFTSFIVVYMLASPFFGALADKGPRRLLIGLGVAVWSLATAAAAFATGFWTLLMARAMVGVGEAAYATIAPSLIADFYPPARRNRVMTIFYVVIPIGAALGFTLGGHLGEAYGWRQAFLVCGLPGLLVACSALLMRDPGRGTFEDPAARAMPPPGWGEALRTMFASRTYLFAVGGYIAVTWGTGGMGDWFVTFLTRERGMGLGQAGTWVGTVTAVGGLCGTACGGLLADRLRGRTRQPYLALAGLSMIPAALAALLALQVQDPTTCVALIAVAQFFLWFYNGPINALIANSVPGAILARAFAVSILLIHLLGDAVSPPIIGAISDATGDLPLALLTVPLALGVGASIWVAGWRLAPEPPGAGS